jgi:tetratricopeptide (TPR) repeat protein
MLALREALSERIRNGMLPALGLSSGRSPDGTLPTNEEAYNIFLRSLALDKNGEPNRQAIGMLERVVVLDPEYAPAWAELARRFYDEGSFGNVTAERSRPLFQQARDAAARSLELDPELARAVQFTVVLAVEQGKLNEAYDRAAAYLERNPDNARAHFTLSYVYRYAGLAEEAARECDAAYAIDPSNPGLRSCGLTHMLLNRYERAHEFFALDVNSILSRWNTIQTMVREGGADEALRLLRANFPRSPTWQDCLEGASPQEIETRARLETEATLRSQDPENKYLVGARMAFCRLPDLAHDLLLGAIEGGYCSYPTMETDPFLESLRDDPRYEEVRRAGQACRQRFLDHLERSGST